MADYAAGDISNTAVTTIEQVVLIPTRGRERLNIEFAVAAAALTGFEVAFVLAPGSTPQVVANATAKFTTPALGNVVLAASGDLTGAAVGEHWAIIDVMGVYEVRIRASSGTSSSVIGTWSAA